MRNTSPAANSSAADSPAAPTTVGKTPPRSWRTLETVLVAAPALAVVIAALLGTIEILPWGLVAVALPLGLAAIVWTGKTWAYTVLGVLGFALMFVPGLFAVAFMVVGGVYVLLSIRGLLVWALKESPRATGDGGADAPTV